MQFSILTLFPEFFESPLQSSILARAQQAGLLSFQFTNLRNFGDGKYRAVDDKPYGGGPGMVMMPEVFERALGSLTDLEALEKSVSQPSESNEKIPHVIYLSPQGQRLTAQKARELSQYRSLVLICGHYEGIDQRVIESFVHEEISIGDYVLTGGEAAALVLVDAVSRFVDGVVGDPLSVASDTFEQAGDMAHGGLKYPMYTRPEHWRGRAVPPVLLSGHHGEITKWRKQQSLEQTRLKRPDLLESPKKKK